VPWSIEPRRRIALGSSCTRDHALAMKAGAFGQIGALRPAQARSAVIRHPGALHF
jgi:hypothetical protein